MDVTINIGLFGKPAWEMKIENEEIKSGAIFKEKGEELKVRLEEVAVLVDKLVASGWYIEGCLYDLCAVKSITLKKAAKELTSMGVDPEDVNLEELEEE